MDELNLPRAAPHTAYYENQCKQGTEALTCARYYHEAWVG